MNSSCQNFVKMCSHFLLLVLFFTVDSVWGYDDYSDSNSTAFITGRILGILFWVVVIFLLCSCCKRGGCCRGREIQGQVYTVPVQVVSTIHAPAAPQYQGRPVPENFAQPYPYPVQDPGVGWNPNIMQPPPSYAEAQAQQRPTTESVRH